VKTLALIGAVGLAACVSESGHSISSMTDGTVVHTLRCDSNWDGCYLAAARICGDGGFREIERSLDSSLSSAGRLERMHTVEGGIEHQRYSENARDSANHRVLTIACEKAP